MALTDFFRINLPYGIKRNARGEWAAFNRDYEPLGANTKNANSDFTYTKYVNVTENLLHKIADGNSFDLNDKKEIVRIWLYNDDTNPASNPECWNTYLKKLKLLSKFEI